MRCKPLCFSLRRRAQLTAPSIISARSPSYTLVSQKPWVKWRLPIICSQKLGDVQRFITRSASPRSAIFTSRSNYVVVAASALLRRDAAHPQMLFFSLKSSTSHYASKIIYKSPCCSSLARVQVCVRKDVCEQEFVPEMQRNKGYSWSLLADGEGSNATCRDGRKQALRAYTDKTYGNGGKPFRLVSSADHSAFKGCSRYRTLRLAEAKLMRHGAKSDAICCGEG
eukprot:4390260-Pleurochrysis_carterae.AAC.4